MKNRKFNIISCPYCGREYLPSEIYLPNSFLGKAEKVMRLTDGKIDVFFGKDMDLRESYVCDSCNSEFNVCAKVTFKTYETSPNVFKEDYVTKISRLKLSED